MISGGYPASSEDSVEVLVPSTGLQCLLRLVGDSETRQSDSAVQGPATPQTRTHAHRPHCLRGRRGGPHQEVVCHLERWRLGHQPPPALLQDISLQLGLSPRHPPSWRHLSQHSRTSPPERNYHNFVLFNSKFEVRRHEGSILPASVLAAQ